VNLAIAGGLTAALQPFAALYVLILASVSPLLAKESDRIYDLFVSVVERFKKLLSRRKKKETTEDEVEEVQG
jgi:CPA2 family monovalent cation:H+ antiporter-2